MVCYSLDCNNKNASIWRALDANWILAGTSGRNWHSGERDHVEPPPHAMSIGNWPRTRLHCALLCLAMALSPIWDGVLDDASTTAAHVARGKAIDLSSALLHYANSIGRHSLPVFCICLEVYDVSFVWQSAWQGGSPRHRSLTAPRRIATPYWKKQRPSARRIPGAYASFINIRCCQHRCDVLVMFLNEGITLVLDLVTSDTQSNVFQVEASFGASRLMLVPNMECDVLARSFFPDERERVHFLNCSWAPTIGLSCMASLQLLR